MSITLQDYNNRILRPMALQYVKEGKADHVLGDILEFYTKIQDIEMIRAIEDRFKALDAVRLS